MLTQQGTHPAKLVLIQLQHTQTCAGVHQECQQRQTPAQEPWYQGHMWGDMQLQHLSWPHTHHFSLTEALTWFCIRAPIGKCSQILVLYTLQVFSAACSLYKAADLLAECLKERSTLKGCRTLKA